MGRVRGEEEGEKERGKGRELEEEVGVKDKRGRR